MFNYSGVLSWLYARLKAFPLHFMSDSFGIFDLSPSKEYVKPFYSVQLFSRTCRETASSCPSWEEVAKTQPNC